MEKGNIGKANRFIIKVSFCIEGYPGYRELPEKYCTSSTCTTQLIRYLFENRYFQDITTAVSKVLEVLQQEIRFEPMYLEAIVGSDMRVGGNLGVELEQNVGTLFHP